MSELVTAPKAKERIASFLYFASLYFVSIGVLYLWGYWTPFGINVLEYLDLSDIVKISSYPMATTLLSTMLGVAIGMWFADRSEPSPDKRSDTAVSRFFRRFAALLQFAFFFFTVSLLFFGPEEKWYVIPPLLAMPITIYVKQTVFLVQVVPQNGPRSAVIFVLALLPLVAYGDGRLAANAIKNGAKFVYVVSELPDYPPGENSQTRPRLIGRAGDHVFFFDPVKTAVVIGKIETGKSMVLKIHSTSGVDALSRYFPSFFRESIGQPRTTP